MIECLDDDHDRAQRAGSHKVAGDKERHASATILYSDRLKSEITFHTREAESIAIDQNLKGTDDDRKDHADHQRPFFSAYVPSFLNVILSEYSGRENIRVSLISP